MNERIKQLAEQADLLWSERDGWWVAYEDSNDLERFAELIRQDEREACAKLCEDEHKLRLAETIRARGNT